MKTGGGVDVLIHVFLPSALAVGEWSAALRPGGKSPWHPLDKMVVGLRNGPG
jgi:hypothetical protein